MTLHSGLEPIPPAECLRLLDRAQVGRVALWDDGPSIVPVCFHVDDASVVLRTAAGSRLASRSVGATVAFEVDALEPTLRTGWSVVVRGRLERVVDEGEVLRLEPLVHAWPIGERDALLRIPIAEISGRRLVPSTRWLPAQATFTG